MTVCVAALADDGKIVVGASDRMLTAHDGLTEYEPHQTKHYWFGDSILAMISGDTQRISDVLRAMRVQFDEEPTRAWRVNEIAALYRPAYAALRQREAEHAFLGPLGLTWETWIDRQHSLAPGLVRRLADLLLDFRLPGIGCLIIGTDDRGAHIVRCLDDQVFREDSAGFAATGIGWMHAESHFMQLRYTRWLGLDIALMATFQAKKLAEASAGVGKDTDVVILGPGIVECRLLREHCEALDKMHDESVRRSDGLKVIDLMETNRFVRESLGIAIAPFPGKAPQADRKNEDGESKSAAISATPHK